MPRFDGGSINQFITLRLFDSLPQKVLRRIEQEVEMRPIENIERQKLILFDKYLDKGYGECFLKNEIVAEIVRDSLVKFHDKRYKLFSWIIMPNHIHLLLKPTSDWELDKILHSFKSYTALEANKVLNRSGKFWMREAFDRRIRDAEHFKKAFRYIENNPVKAGLCKSKEDWKFSSAYK